MRIANIGSRGFPGFNAGVEKSLEEVCSRLSERGHEVTLYCSDHVTTAEPVYKGTVLKRIPSLPTKHLETITRVALSGWDALHEDFDIVHFHSIGPALLSWMTSIGKCKTVVTVHGLDWQRAKWGPLARASLQIGERSSVLFPDETIVVSKFLQRYYQEHYKKEVTCIPNGVNVSDPLPAKEITQKWGLQGGDYILFASRLVPEKECHTLIQAYQKLKTGKKLVIAGASWHSDDYVKQLREIAKSNSKDNPNILFIGWAEGDLLAELYSSAFLYCLPSQIEGLSLGLLEAMSYGVCPLISGIPENREAVGEHGMSFQMGNAADLAARLQEAISNPREVACLGKAARLYVKEEYSWERNLDNLEKTYLRLLNE